MNRKTRKNRICTGLTALLLSVLLLFTGGASVLAAEGETVSQAVTITVPSPSSDFYVYDEANVLSEETKSLILTTNQSLYTAHGVQMVVAIMNTLDGVSIEEYARTMMTNWQIGGTAQRGVLILLDIGGDTYFVKAGEALSGGLTRVVLKSHLDAELEPYFAEKQYDAGVYTLFAALSELTGSLARSSNMTPVPSATPEPVAPEATPGGAGTVQGADKQEEGIPFFQMVLIVIFLLVLLIAIFFLVVWAHGQQVKKRRAEERRRRAAARAAQQPYGNGSMPPSGSYRGSSAPTRDTSYQDFMNRYK